MTFFPTQSDSGDDDLDDQNLEVLSESLVEFADLAAIVSELHEQCLLREILIPDETQALLDADENAIFDDLDKQIGADAAEVMDRYIQLLKEIRERLEVLLAE